ncbi:MAG: hypothetical protein ABI382_07570 [Nakamurella sp.]
MSAVFRGVRGFAAFWWDFIVGDDWRIAVGVVLALFATWGLTAAGVPAWWLMPVAGLTILTLSVGLAVRAHDRVQGQRRQ